MEYWIANGTGKDSLIYVKQDAGDYALVEGSTYEYGIDVDAALFEKRFRDWLSWKERIMSLLKTNRIVWLKLMEQ